MGIVVLPFALLLCRLTDSELMSACQCFTYIMVYMAGLGPPKDSLSTSSHLPMAPPLVFDFIGIVFTAILYGLYCLIFGLYWQIQLKRADRWKGILLYALTVNFILCTMYFIIGIIQVQFRITMEVLNETSLIPAVEWMTIANNFLYTAIDLISQLILLYRCWIMWRQPLIMVIPCILSLAFLVIALTTLGYQIKGVASNGPVPDWYLSAVTAFFFVSLAVNALVTVLIVYKIVTVYNDIRGFNSNAQANAHGS